MKRIRLWLRLATERSVVRRASVTALLVGTILSLITRGEMILSADFSMALSWQLGLLFVVPYSVSTWSSVAAASRQRALDEASAHLHGPLVEDMDRFPDENPNPVMRVAVRGGELMYANPACQSLVGAMQLTVGAPLPAALLADLRAAAKAGSTVEVRDQSRTFSLLPVLVPAFDFMNVYGTDITAALAVARFPDQNPNPVLRVDEQGSLIYANAASATIVEAFGVQIGQALPAELVDRLRLAQSGQLSEPIEIQGGGRTYALKPVQVEGFGFTNIYGTDVTAMRALDKFPDQNPNVVMRMTRGGRLTYANPASELVRRAIGATVGEELPEDFCDQVQRMVEATTPEPIEIDAEGHIYELLVVSVYEFDSINLYGTDVTAARAIERLAKENERLLLNILPASIVERLRSGEDVIADRFDELTVLFADCVGFTAMSSHLPPSEVVQQLNGVFSIFDRLADKYDLEKIKTIGDAYMVVGGLTPSGDHPERVAAMGLEMLDEIAAMRAAMPTALDVRVGMHVGPAVAGVIGLKKFMYDVWGDTVNIASRMESLGSPGRIQVTESTYQRLKHAFEFEPRGSIEVKGLGPTQTYFITGRLG
ncbi:MAG: adenylate/guanylate cyclase domain-containing protein [Candidatus Limnocylindria bacterium]